MSNDILSKEEFSAAVSYALQFESYGAVYGASTIKIIRSHNAAIKRIAELEELEKENKSSYEKIEEKNKKIAVLESRLAAYEPVGDTQEDAREKAFKDALAWIDRDTPGKSSAPIIHDRNKNFYQCSSTGKKHFYAVPRDPQTGDLMYSKTYNSVFTFCSQKGPIVFAKTGAAYEREECTPTGYRVDKDGSIVSIALKSE
jgi:hypothetical protein